MEIEQENVAISYTDMVYVFVFFITLHSFQIIILKTISWHTVKSFSKSILF